MEATLYRLFAWPNSYAMGVHAMLEELGVDYEVRWVKIMVDDLDPDFVAASPHGRVPALVAPGGTLFETGAIALFLAETHPEAGLLVPPGDPGRARFLQWFHYFASTLQPDVMIQFHPEFYFDDAETRARFQAASMERLGTVLTTLEAALDPGPYFMGGQRSLLDYLFALQAVWPEVYPTAIEDYPRINHLVTSLLQRPAVKKVHELHMAAAKTIDRTGMHG